uniref:Acidic repeat-containing protein-like n=1 Tax=Saccoglossus kowalevskii TaxID=10224 RepID=A0ABM0MAK9_SACKO|nr:PREDICTED: acidic repeat-containing protein-like [Saccoglossus kowalevskii]
MIGVVEEPSGKAVLSTVLDHDIFESAVDDDDSRKSWKNEKIVKKVITSTPEKLHVDNSEEDNHSARNGDIVQSSSQKNETISQDSDNEIDSSTYKERNRLLIFDSDDDDGNGDDALVEIKSNGQHEVDKDSSDGDDSDDDVVLSTFKKKNRSFLDSDCDDENDDKSETPMRKKIKKTILESDDESDDEEKKDDDSEDEEENRASDNNDADEEMNNGEEMIRAKSTKERSDRELKPRRAKKSDVQSIHSESQRIVRESVVSLPYHKPKPLSLDDFFNKKPIIKELKPIKGKIPTRWRRGD